MAVPHTLALVGHRAAWVLWGVGAEDSPELLSEENGGVLFKDASLLLSFVSLALSSASSLEGMGIGGRCSKPS